MAYPAGAAAETAPARLKYADSLSIPAIESPFLESMLAVSGYAPEIKLGLRSLARDGYVVFDIGMPDFPAVAERISADLRKHWGKDRRVSEAWYWNPDVRAVANAPRILEYCRLIYRREPIPFQTLNFEIGSEQPAHSDTIHFHSLPRHYMCGVWVAMEDIHPESGPLVVYPGSHKLPDYDMQDLGVPPNPGNYYVYEEFVRDALASLGIAPTPVLLKQGQCVLWLANLYHGGTAIRDPQRTRHSQATHYYFEDCQYYFPMQSDLPAGKITRREVIDLRNGKFVPHFHQGRQVDLGDLRDVCTYPRPLPDWVG